MSQHYGPVSYYEPGRVYPRDRLRDPFRRIAGAIRRLLAPLFGVVPPPPRVIPIIGTDNTVAALIGIDNSALAIIGIDNTRAPIIGE